MGETRNTIRGNTGKTVQARDVRGGINVTVRKDKTKQDKNTRDSK